MPRRCVKSCESCSVHATSLVYSLSTEQTVDYRGGGGAPKVPAAYNSKTIHGIEMKFGRIVENYKLINLI